MKTIHKYPIDMGGTRLQIHQGYQIIKVDNQGEKNPCFWAIVDTDKPKEERSFIVLGTGSAFLPGMQYVGTWQEPPFVWHLFDISEIKLMRAHDN